MSVLRSSGWDREIRSYLLAREVGVGPRTRLGHQTAELHAGPSDPRHRGEGSSGAAANLGADRRRWSPSRERRSWQGPVPRLLPNKVPSRPDDLCCHGPTVSLTELFEKNRTGGRGFRQVSESSPPLPPLVPKVLVQSFRFQEKPDFLQGIS